MHVPHYARLALLLAVAAACTTAAAARVQAAAAQQRADDATICRALPSATMQFQGGLISSTTVSSRGKCCEACANTKGCQMWWYDDSKSKDFVCSMHSLDKGSVTLSILYNARAGLMTSSSFITPSSECDGDVWLFNNIDLIGGNKASPADPYSNESPFSNGFQAVSWQDCCKAARTAPGTTIMERSYAYRARQFWSYSQGKCWVKVRPFLQGADVVKLQRTPGTISGMFGNEL